MNAFSSKNDAAYDALRRRVRHQHTLNALAAQKRRKRRWFLAYSLLILSTLVGALWATSKESSLGAALKEAAITIYQRQTATIPETAQHSDSNDPRVDQR